MWTGSYSQRVSGLSAEKIWRVWTDVNRWNEWQDDLEFARLQGEFRNGATFQLRPKGGPNVKVELVNVEPNINYTDLTRFPLAKMTGSHDLIQRGNELEVRTTMTVTGPLAFLWSRIVAKGIVAALPKQTQGLIERARGLEIKLVQAG
jgi:polyketide cyclase/dehydrase/lipid transport protein